MKPEVWYSEILDIIYIVHHDDPLNHIECKAPSNFAINNGFFGDLLTTAIYLGDL